MTEEENKVYENFYNNLTLCESFWDKKDFTMGISDAFVLRRIIERMQKNNQKLKRKVEVKLSKLKKEMDKEYDMYGKSDEFLNLDEQYDFLNEIKELLEKK